MIDIKQGGRLALLKQLTQPPAFLFCQIPLVFSRKAEYNLLKVKEGQSQRLTMVVFYKRLKYNNYRVLA
jgi:hypothetical protein